MASSSILSGPFSRDVFLSFRGRDSRKIIVDPLCTALNLEGIRTFFNDPELKGEGMSWEEIQKLFATKNVPVWCPSFTSPARNLYSQLLPVLEGLLFQLLPVPEGLSFQLRPVAKMSKISIVVLSKSYASSGRCLDELVELMNTEKQHVIPIFYHVDRADVVHQTGGFGTAFRKHTDMMKADTWKTTLSKIGRFPGYHLPNAQKWLEPELISVIVRNVCELLWGNDSFGSDINVTELNEVGALASCDSGSDVLCNEESLETDPNRICQVPGAPNVVTGSENMPEISHEPIALSRRHLLAIIGSPRILTANLDDVKKVELDFHGMMGTPSDITEILGLMEKISQHPFLKSKVVAVIKLKVIHMSSSKVPKIPKNLSFTDLERLVLHPDFDFSSITSSFFKSFPAFPVLDMSHSSIKTLPSWVYKLTDLKGLILQRCELLIELPDGIGALENLELLDLEGTHLVCLPDELGKLINLVCLKVSLYYDDSYRKSRKILDIIPTALLSKLTKLEELSIKFDPQDVWCNALVKAIIADLLSLRKLKTLKLYLPSIELLQNLMELKSNEDDMSIYQNLSNFSVIIGPHGQRFISRLPCDLEEEYLKLKKCLKYIAGKDNTSEFFAEALKHANALYLDRHWNIQKLSIFKADKLNKLKFCMLVDCNEMQTVFDASDFNHEDNILSLQYLAIHYLRNLEVIWKGPHVVCCLQYLKVLVLHMCPNLTTIFTPVLLGVLVNLKEITVEDCAKITSLVSGDSTQLTGTEHLLRLKKLSLLYLPELESISSGISIGPKLENVVIYDCPKLKILPSLRVHNEKVIKIEGEGEWWNALEWSDGQPQYIHNAFSELDIEGAFLDELGTQYVNSLRLFVEECNAN